ncbi:Nce101p ASCRUDRAFT_75987 [Ascoidea rubescens DSM 1968]|uniref:Non-classical export protein 1 n=1 Tax=Ascoidea rubescens DSM 1968 TaxID=1344418 RepID=A0A1D2VI05_9ASCO|nr:hypothetical protein ASCRUDRAFT_75987 [Ascoidea rubescens DSM 1968]ODV61294.1 hypothetical protein ASCRUDRAFT_75987 [Ascoidea rubescens DSM 1968]
MAPYPYMLSRTLDPIFSIFVGVVSYYSYEARIQRPEGHTLNELIAKRYHQTFGPSKNDE